MAEDLHTDERLKAVPRRISWPPIRTPELVALLLSVVGITASWVPSRYREFMEMAWWEAAGLVLIYGLVPIVVWGVGRAALFVFRRLRQYPALFDYSAGLESELARSRAQVGRLSEALVGRMASTDDRAYMIAGAYMHGVTVSLALVPGDLDIPAPGTILLVMSSLTREYLGTCEVMMSWGDYFHARVLDAEPIFDGFIRDWARHHARVETFAVAVAVSAEGDGQ